MWLSPLVEEAYLQTWENVFAASCSFPSIFCVNLFLWESSKAHQGKPPPPHFLIILHNPALYLIQYFSWKCKGLGMDQCWQNTTSLRFWEKTNLSRRYVSYMSKWWRGGRFKAHLFPRCDFQAEECHIFISILQNWFFSQNSAMSSIFLTINEVQRNYVGLYKKFDQRSQLKFPLFLEVVPSLLSWGETFLLDFKPTWYLLLLSYTFLQVKQANRMIQANLAK